MVNMPDVRPGRIKGVFRRGRKFAVTIRIPCGKAKYFGTYETENEANEVAIHKYSEMREEYDLSVANFLC